MATTFYALGTLTSNGSASSMTFSNIPNTYKHLWIIGGLGTSNEANVNLRFNGDGGFNYTFQEIWSTGSAPVNQISDTWNRASGNNTSYPFGDYGAFGFEALIPNYLSNKWKQVLWDSGSGKGQWAAAHGYNSRTTSTWKSTSAITSVTIALSGGTMTNTSKVTLYGLI